MKNVLLILLLALPLFVSAQNREMTVAEKDAIKTNAAFIVQVNGAIASKASYYTQNSIYQTLINADGIEKYGKVRNFLNSVKYQNAVDPNAANLFIFLSKGMTLVPPGQYSEQAVIDYMVANGKFDELTDLYVTVKIATTYF